MGGQSVETYAEITQIIELIKKVLSSYYNKILCVRRVEENISMLKRYVEYI